MKPGSLVVTVYNFDLERERWGLNYPSKGDILTIKFMGRNTDKPTAFIDGKIIDVPNDKTIITNLWFEELNLPIGLADKKIGGRPNFIEIQSPEEAMQLLEDINNTTNERISAKTH